MNLPRPPKKKTRVIAKARREGELKAEVEHEYKSVKFLADMLPFLPEKYKKNAILWMKNIIERHLHRIPKGVALIGMTLIVKGLIRSSEELYVKCTKVWAGWGKGLGTPLGFGMPWAEETATYFAKLYGWKASEDTDAIPEWAEWLIAFTIAYIIIEHGGQILNFGQQGLTSLVGLLLA